MMSFQTDTQLIPKWALPNWFTSTRFEWRGSRGVMVGNGGINFLAETLDTRVDKCKLRHFWVMPVLTITLAILWALSVSIVYFLINFPILRSCCCRSSNPRIQSGAHRRFLGQKIINSFFGAGTERGTWNRWLFPSDHSSLAGAAAGIAVDKYLFSRLWWRDERPMNDTVTSSWRYVPFWKNLLSA